MLEDRLELVKFVDEGFELEVNVSPQEETVWLSQEQMALLFQKAKSTINHHINNAFSTGELTSDSRRKFEKIEFNKKPTFFYDLDVVIAVGYRVNSKRGILFRKWATGVLKQYMLRGYAIDPTRTLVTNENYLSLVNVVTDMKDSQIKLEDRLEKLEVKYPELTNKLFFDGQLWDAISCIESIFTRARNSIVLIDNYSDTQTLDMLSKKKSNVSVILVTDKRTSRLTQKEVSAFNTQYGKLSIFYSKDFHDRFIIVDNATLYHCGASIKDAGRKTFAISRIDDPALLNTLLSKKDLFLCSKNQKHLKEALEVSTNTLSMMDSSIKNMKNGTVSKTVTLATMRATHINENMHGPFESVEALIEDLNADD